MVKGYDCRTLAEQQHLDPIGSAYSQARNAEERSAYRPEATELRIPQWPSNVGDAIDEVLPETHNNFRLIFEFLRNDRHTRLAYDNDEVDEIRLEAEYDGLNHEQGTMKKPGKHAQKLFGAVGFPIRHRLKKCW